jgi:predicted nuclease of predicted toxin-antitoxin system
LRLVIIEKAFDENWILITSDKDFGEKVYREQKPHRGVVLLRLGNERSTNKIDVLRRLLDGYSEQLTDSCIVATEKQVRFARLRS